jgi:cell surface protein SprA
MRRAVKRLNSRSTTSRILFSVPEQEVGSIRVNERYQPLIGLDLNFRNRLATQIAYSKSNAYSLSASNLSVSESKTNEFTFSANYQKTGNEHSVPVWRRLNNRVGLTLTLARSYTLDQRYALDRAVRAAASEADFVMEDALRGDFVTLVTGATQDFRHSPDFLPVQQSGERKLLAEV